MPTIKSFVKAPITPLARPDFSVLICLLGSFRILRFGNQSPVRVGNKAENLLSEIATSPPHGITRENLIESIWPDRPIALATQSLNSLVYSVQKSLGVGPDALPPLIYREGHYCLNVDAGIGVDVLLFEDFIKVGDAEIRHGRPEAAMGLYEKAADLYRGDYVFADHARAIVERERLQSEYQRILMRLAEHSLMQGDDTGSLERARLVLANDPCREDAHRIMMRCYVNLGERVHALRQYRMCERLLHEEFTTNPEPATTRLFDRIRAGHDLEHEPLIERFQA